MAKKFKLAVSSADDAPKTAPLLLLGSIRENLITASGMGYDALEIHMRENTTVDYDEILKVCEEYKIKIATVVSGRLAVQEKVSIADADNSSVKKAMDGLFKYIDIASALKTDLIIGWIRGRVTEPETYADFEKRFAQNIKIVAEKAAEKNVKLFIEAINRYEINTCNTAEETLGLIEKHALQNVYVHLDTFHMNIEEADIEKAILLCGDKLGYIHFADSNRHYPGAGHINFKPVFNALEKINYKGYVSVECLPIPNGKEAAKKAIENLEPFIK